jgi:hypothetical protein
VLCLADRRSMEGRLPGWARWWGAGSFEEGLNSLELKVTPAIIIFGQHCRRRRRRFCRWTGAFMPINGDPVQQTSAVFAGAVGLPGTDPAYVAETV